MDIKKQFLKLLGFILKDNSSGIYYKKYHDNTIIEVDFEKEIFNFGGKIKIYDKEIQNITKPEDWVVFECVNRLLEKGYNSEDILLEKVYPTGRGTSGRLDILIMKEGKAFLMIECKTWGTEFEKELKNMQKNGGQLFTYFQQDRDSEFLVLYTSNFDGKEIEYKNEIVKIEESYRETSNVVEFYDRWNKFTKQNGIFENWVKTYNFESRALTLKDLHDIKESDASFIFNRFLEILRHNTVSDKPNAFNKMFTLFLCKIYDEGHKRQDEELEFQWIEGVDNYVIFQTRLTDLYKRGMKTLLEKEVSDFSNKEFESEFGTLDPSTKQKIWEKILKIRLQKNNEFAIKEVFDEETFEDNAKVLKEIVELLQNYRVRYTKKQPFLGDFFELLLTTGLKQESGQFFTPVPIARFICKSIPIKNIIEEKLENGDITDLLPTTIDYAAGSGHFLTESMEEIQNIIKNIPKNNLRPDVAKSIKSWDGNFDWAYDYMYGIEKDYRLVKTAKVGCFLHGDGIANVIHGDGLDSFEFSKHYRGKLIDFNKDDKQENARFDLILSNPPYSVSAFKNNLNSENAKNDFDLYSRLTDNSSEIECLFIERTKQLLKEGGIAGIILPSSILSNTGIYTKAREIILKNFYIISIVSLGSGTFMATGTNTVTLFLRKRNKFFASNLEISINKFFTNLVDISLNNIENVFSKYVNYVWDVSFEDYKTLIQKSPNEAIKKSELFIDYSKKLKLQRTEDIYDKIIEIEKEKILYFVLTYNQNIVLVKSGEKQVEKEFLGYEFSFRKGSEGIHPMKGGKLIDDCTKLFDPDSFDNESKASTYIYDAFNNKFDREINEELTNHISRTKLVDLLTFDRVEFEKTISTNVKKKIEIDSKWEIKKLGELIKIIRGVTYGKEDQENKITEKSILTADNITLDGNLEINKQIYLKEDYSYDYEKNLKKDDIFICFSSGSIKHLGKLAYITEDTNYFAGGFMGILRNSNSNIYNKFLYNLLNTDFYRNYVISFGSGSNINNLSSVFSEVRIPVPPLDIQQKIIGEIEILEKVENEEKERIDSLKNEIEKVIFSEDGEKRLIKNICLLNPSKKEISDISNETMVSFVEMSSVSNNGFIEKKLYRPLKELRKGSYTYFKEGDIIMAKITPCMENGKCALAENLSNNLGMGSSEFHVIRCGDEINNKFLFTFLNRQIIRENAEKQMTGASGHRRVPISFYESLEISLPPLEAQKQIVSQIEKIENEIEVLEGELKQIPEKKKQILKKYL